MAEPTASMSCRSGACGCNLAANPHITITTDNAYSNACFMVRPAWAFGLTEADFTGSPTRWVFPPARPMIFA